MIKSYFALRCSILSRWTSRVRPGPH